MKARRDPRRGFPGSPAGPLVTGAVRQVRRQRMSPLIGGVPRSSPRRRDSQLFVCGCYGRGRQPIGRRRAGSQLRIGRQRHGSLGLVGSVRRGGRCARSDGGGGGGGPKRGLGGRGRDAASGGGGGGRAAGRAGSGGGGGSIGQGARGGGAAPGRAVGGGGAMERRPPAGREAQAGWAAAALLGRERQAREYCPGVNNQPYVCETGHCCGETGCCIYYYELWWFWLLWTVLILFSCCCAYRHRRAKLRLQQQQRQREINLIAYHGACNYPPSMMDLRMLASFKLPAYEEVANRPTTPPPAYSAILGGSASHLGSSTLTLTGSSDNYTSCSCESSCLTSPSSTSLSATEVSTPSEGDTEADGGAAGGGGGSNSSSMAGSWELAGQAGAGPATPRPRHTLFSSHVELFEGELQRVSDSDDGPEAVDEHFRHRRLTGDSGIEVGHGQEEEEEEEVGEEATHLLEKGVPCSSSTPESRSLCGVQTDGEPEELASSPTLPA